MEITNIIVICFVTLTEDFIIDNFFPCIMIHSLIKNKFNWINDIVIETRNIIGF